jgi:hypothetical protein
MKILPFNGERIAQLVIAKHERAVVWSSRIIWNSRGEGGFGMEEIKVLPRIDNTNRTI